MRWIILIIVAVSFSGCRRQVIVPLFGHLKLTLNGSFVPFDLFGATRPGYSTGELIIVGSQSTRRENKIQITIKNFNNSVGEHNLTGGNEAVLIYNGPYYFTGMASPDFGGGQRGRGKVTITEVSQEYIKGTFEFTATDLFPGGSTVKVTQGEFHLKRDL
jgi:hypothetical protein